jgi:hypothetical protein
LSVLTVLCVHLVTVVENFLLYFSISFKTVLGVGVVVAATDRGSTHVHCLLRGLVRSAQMLEVLLRQLKIHVFKLIVVDDFLGDLEFAFILD